jgi:hypothetical protein
MATDVLHEVIHDYIQCKASGDAFRARPELAMEEISRLIFELAEH